MTKYRLHQHGAWVARAEAACCQHFGVVTDPAVVHLPQLTDDEYDQLLSRSIVFLNLLASVASNTILECIRRHVPVVVNRLAGPVHYLGEEYPLFYNRMEDVNDLLTEENILAAHEYLKRWSCRCLGAGDFAEEIAARIGALIL